MVAFCIVIGYHKQTKKLGSGDTCSLLLSPDERMEGRGEFLKWGVKVFLERAYESAVNRMGQ